MIIYIFKIIIKLIMMSSWFDPCSTLVRPQKPWTSPFYSSMNGSDLKTLLRDITVSLYGWKFQLLKYPSITQMQCNFHMSYFLSKLTFNLDGRVEIKAKTLCKLSQKLQWKSIIFPINLPRNDDVCFAKFFKI